MAKLKLDDDQVQALLQVLESSLSDLSFEIADTDREEYRDQIKARRDLLQSVFDKLKQAGE